MEKQVLEVSVEDRTYQIDHTCINYYPNSYFAHILDNRLEEKGHVIITEVKADIFEKVLSYMRSRNALPWCENLEESENFIKALEFFCILPETAGFERFPKVFFQGAGMRDWMIDTNSFSPLLVNLGCVFVPTTFRVNMENQWRCMRPFLALVERDVVPQMTLEEFETTLRQQKLFEENFKNEPLWKKLIRYNISETMDESVAKPTLEKILMNDLDFEWAGYEHSKLRLISIVRMLKKYWQNLPEGFLETLGEDPYPFGGHFASSEVDYYDYHPGEGLWTWRKGDYKSEKKLNLDGNLQLNLIYQPRWMGLPCEISFLPYGYTLPQDIEDVV